MIADGEDTERSTSEYNELGENKMLPANASASRHHSAA